MSIRESSRLGPFVRAAAAVISVAGLACGSAPGGSAAGPEPGSSAAPADTSSSTATATVAPESTPPTATPTAAEVPPAVAPTASASASAAASTTPAKPKGPSYVACGCGCCGGTTPEKQCLYHAKGDDLDKIMATDKAARQNPRCRVMGCSRGVEYSYCD